jgi:secondary thiamine-phosphate synthase enzyme
MIVRNAVLKVRTEGFTDCVDITELLNRALNETGIKEGLLTVIVPGSTAGITTIEFESGAVQDLKDALEKLAPLEAVYAHNERWRDGNGFAHVRAALMKPSLSIPVINGQMALGTWQQVVFLDFDNKPRTRSLAVSLIGIGRT